MESSDSEIANPVTKLCLNQAECLLSQNAMEKCLTLPMILSFNVSRVTIRINMVGEGIYILIEQRTKPETIGL